MNKIICIIGCKNESFRIEKCLAPLIENGLTVVVADAMSDDDTVIIAEEMGALVIKHTYSQLNIKSKVKYVFERLTAKSLADDQDYFIYMNASEVFNSQLIGVIKKCSKKGYSGMSVYRQSYTFGTSTHHSRFAFILNSIIFNKNYFRIFRYCDWDFDRSKIHHEYPLKKSCVHNTCTIFPIAKLYIRHYRAGDLRFFEDKHALYSSEEARERLRSNKKPSILRLLFLPTLLFLYWLPVSLFSKRRFITHVYHCFYKFQVEAKMFIKEKK
jgi:glycosyltransferase involved in cell wall biosynthesis